MITNLRIQFLATLRKPDGTREGRTVFFSDDPGDLSVDEFDATPPLQLESRRGVQTLRFQVRDAGAGENLYTVELKLTWNNRTKTFVASMKAATEVVEGRFYSARTYPGSRPGVILAAGPPRVIYDGGVAVGASGAVRRTGD